MSTGFCNGFGGFSEFPVIFVENLQPHFDIAFVSIPAEFPAAFAPVR